jgi:hypothetical protein
MSDGIRINDILSSQAKQATISEFRSIPDQI